MGMLIGGIIPALLLGLFGVLLKAANNNGIGVGIYLVLSGLTVTLVGVVTCLGFPEKEISLRSATLTCLASLFWAVSMAMIQLALKKYDVEISRLVPLFNMNTLIAVVLGLWIFSEWDNMNSLTLVTGAFCIVLGGILVTIS